MSRSRTAPDREVWVYAPGVSAEALRTPVAALNLPARLLEACKTAGATTLVEVLALQKPDLLAIKGVGQRSWQQLQRAVCRHLDAYRRPTPRERKSGFDGLVLPLRARLALTRLGLTRREAWLAAVPETLLAIPELDSASIAAAHAAFTMASPTTLWPSRILRASLLRLDLPPQLRRALAAAGIRTLGDLRCVDPSAVAAIPDVGTSGLRTLRVALANSLELTGASSTEPVGGRLESLLTRLSAADRHVVEHFLCAKGGRHSEVHLARELRVPIQDVGDHVARARQALLTCGDGTLRKLRAAGSAELIAQGGVIHHELLAARSPLRGFAGTGDPAIALRLLAFLTPETLSVHDDVLLELPAATYPRIARELDRAMTALSLPVPLPRAQAELTAAGLPPLRRGLLRLLLEHAPRVELVTDPVHGDTLRRRSMTRAARIAEILASSGGPRQACDIQFAYRDRFGTARKARLVDTLHADAAFLRVGPDEWDLRERHRDALHSARAEANRVRDLILAEDRVSSLVDLVDPGSSGRQVYLIRDLLHRDPALRSLGRGVFCSRAHRTSTHIQLLRQELRRAMGEIPLQRFLANQPENTRRIRARLLAENRLFVSSSPDRVDLVTNYPLDDERLGRLHDVVERLTARAGGHERIERVSAQLRTDEFGGSFLTAHFLADLFRRHGRFETLAGDLVTRTDSGVRERIMHRVRMVIRAADQAVTVHDILAASPDLAEFAEILPTLLHADPLVQRRDERYALP